jgi:hypothetical protein
VLTHSRVRGRLVRAELQALVDYQREPPGREEEWQQAPIGRCTVTVELFNVADDQLVGRQHIDLANVGQPGPVWHLQFGGNPSGGKELSNSWLSVPRWAMAPADLVLVADQLVYNLHPQTWVAMQEDGDWLRLVLASEELVLQHYANHLGSHFARTADRRSISWLQAQDNAMWDPRPTSPTSAN